MTQTLLVANRGEIAARVITTAQGMGIRTVAVYSDADAGALPVQLADEAVRIGPAPVGESYLQADTILDAARQTGSTLIHPGYGFLSENPDFAEACAAAGITFVGPPARAIRAMGLKDAAKALMEQTGVPVVPGYHGSDQDPGLLAAEADKIGYPVLIKARAGGGGKGMRLVETPADFAAALESAQREASAAFGDPACLIEKFITSPRHIEIQVFADAHGSVVHLFERDCSLQRRHQKVIEEAPAPGMTEEVRLAMGTAATDAARAIGYVGAGTVEFIVDGSGPLRPDGFWFMEMNTRLQVEHPVTEAVTGLDLVELQLRTALGQPLPFAQGDLTLTGHAMEARLYAEDPSTGFLPATGPLRHLQFPDHTAFAAGGLRVDSGVRTGDTITPYYDPMIAKVIAHGPDRETARQNLSRALTGTQIAGTTTNLSFLIRLLNQSEFGAGQVDTGLIDRNLDALTAPTPSPATVRAVAQLCALGLLPGKERGDPFSRLVGWRAWGPSTAHTQLDDQGTTTDAVVTVLGTNSFVIEGQPVSISSDGDGIFSVTMGNQTQTCFAHRADENVTVIMQGETYVFAVKDPLTGADQNAASGDTILAPMPGQITALNTAVGAKVTEGAALITLEAMKMEHSLTAPRDGAIAEITAAPGDQVAQGAVLIRLESADD